MTHVWSVKRDGRHIGTVEAVSRKGACHAAYEKFDIDHTKRSTISVGRAPLFEAGVPVGLYQHGEYVVSKKWGKPFSVIGGRDPAKEVHIVCSFNPALAGEAQEKSLETCRAKFETAPFSGFPRKPE